jgi:hypothetical protein
MYTALDIRNVSIDPKPFLCRAENVVAIAISPNLPLGLITTENNALLRSMLNFVCPLIISAVLIWSSVTTAWRVLSWWMGQTARMDMESSSKCAE